MNLEPVIREKFGLDVVAEKAGDLLFERENALKVMDECQRLGGTIIGMNFWKEKDGDVIEVNSTDYSSINALPEASNETINAARSLTKDKLPDDADYVSFVLE